MVSLKVDHLIEMVQGKDTLLLLNDMDLLCEDPKATSDYIAELFDKDRVIIKNHTRDPTIYGRLQEFDRLPCHVPAEIIMRSYSFHFIVGLYMTKSLLLPVEGVELCLQPMIGWKPVGNIGDVWYGLAAKNKVWMIHDPHILSEIIKEAVVC